MRHVDVMILLFFFEVRNAYATVFMVVVGTILELLLGRSAGLRKVLEAFLNALVQGQYRVCDDFDLAKEPTFVSTNCHFSPTRAASKLHISRRTSM